MIITIARTTKDAFFANATSILPGLSNLNTHNPVSNKIGMSGGYIKRLFLRSPSNNKKRDRCAPQVGQSIPNISLYAHGSIYIKTPRGNYMVDQIEAEAVPKMITQTIQ